jgi:hypothetical protein
MLLFSVGIASTNFCWHGIVDLEFDCNFRFSTILTTPLRISSPLRPIYLEIYYGPDHNLIRPPGFLAIAFSACSGERQIFILFITTVFLGKIRTKTSPPLVHFVTSTDVRNGVIQRTSSPLTVNAQHKSTM